MDDGITFQSGIIPIVTDFSAEHVGIYPQITDCHIFEKEAETLKVVQ